MRWKLAWLLGIAAALAGCPINSARAATMKIVCLGDSTTALRDTVKQVYAQRLAAELPRLGIEAEVINAGVPSNRTDQGRERLEKDVLAKKPDLVIVQFGINDAAADVWRDPPETTSRIALADYERNLHTLVQQIRASGAKVILMTPNPTRWTKLTLKLYGKPPYKPDDPDGFNVLLRDYAAAARRVAREEHVPLVDVYAVFNDSRKPPIDELLLDGMHPNDAGHKIIADLLIQQIADKTNKQN